MIQIPKFIKDVTKYFQYETYPTPTTQDELQAFHKNQNSTLACLVDQLWQPETTYEINHQVFSPNMPKGFKATVKQAGITGSNEPDWGDGSIEIIDGSVTWKLSKGNITVNGNEPDQNGNITIPTYSPDFASDSEAIQGTSGTKIMTPKANNAVLGNVGYWQPSKSVTVNTVKFLKGEKYAGYYLKCTTGGTTGTTQPAPATTSTADFSDGTAKWQIKQISDSKEVINTSVGKYPSWYFDRGDGSDGVFNPSSATTISGVKNYTSVNIPSGVIVTVDKVIRIKCQGTFTNNGTITSVGKGQPGGSGGHPDGTAGSSGSGGAGGASAQNAGGAGYSIGSISFGTPDKIGFCIPKIGAGGAGGDGDSRYTTGGAGGAGGGSIIITTHSFNNQGTISSSGVNGGTGGSSGSTLVGADGGGGGGGGEVVVITKSLISTGTITAKGGAGGAGGRGATRYGETGASGGDGLEYIKELGV